MRCLTLAELLRDRGADVRFLCREHAGNLARQLRECAFNVDLLPISPTADPKAEDGAYSAWLGASESEDAEQTIHAIRDSEVEWLIVDHYGIGVEWERKLRPHVRELLVVDDLANRPHSCDMLLDQNFFAEDRKRYARLVDERCRFLLGPRFALLGAEYRDARRRVPRRDGRIGRVLVFFGGTDPCNLTGMTLDALCVPGLRHLPVDVVMGVNNPHNAAVRKLAAGRPKTTIYGPQRHLADLMARADLAIGAGGVTTWERMIMGLPSVVITIAENQRPSTGSLAKAGLIAYVGHYDRVTRQDLTGAIRDAISNPRDLSDISLKCCLLVDGCGALRVLEIIQPTAADSLRLRVAQPDDVYRYFEWANDPDVRAQAVQTSLISIESHERWFAAKLASPHAQLFVLMAGDLPVGQIRFDREGNDYRVDYSIDRDYRGRTWASRLVALGMSKSTAERGARFVAEVRENNLRSRAVFARLGFRPQPSTRGDAFVEYRTDAVPEARAEGAP